MLPTTAVAIELISDGSWPIPGAHPARLANAARLRGLEPAQPATARVLELASATGRNLIPLAERYPQASFLGIDNGDHVDLATAGAAAIGLTNVAFRRQDVFDLPGDLGQFDYILVPALYSSADASRRDKLLGAIRNHLAPHGVAYVSYYANPGWGFSAMLGSIMRWEARGARSPAERVGKARGLLDFLIASLTADHPYHAQLRTEAAAVARISDVDLQQTYLSGQMCAHYLREMLAHADRQALQYLGDASAGARYAEPLDEQIETDLALASAAPLELEQYRDVLRNRRIRETLLTHRDVPIQTSLTTGQLNGLFLEARFRPQDSKAKLESTELVRFVGAHGVAVSTSKPLVKAALVHLDGIWPGTIGLADLLTAASQRAELPAGSGSTPPAELERLRQTLLECCEAGVIEVHAEPPNFVTHGGPRPQATEWARWQAAHGEVVANCRLNAVPLEPFDAQVLELLDGRRDFDTLVELLVASAQQGRLGVVEQAQQIENPTRLREVLRLALRQSLARLAHSALLIA